MSDPAYEATVFNRIMDILTSGPRETQLVAVSRAGALLTSICRMTSNPEAALEFSIKMIQERLDALRAGRHE